MYIYPSATAVDGISRFFKVKVDRPLPEWRLENDCGTDVTTCLQLARAASLILCQGHRLTRLTFAVTADPVFASSVNSLTSVIRPNILSKAHTMQWLVIVYSCCNYSSPRAHLHVVWVLRYKPTELAHSVLFCSCVCFCLYGPFSCISFNKFSRQLSAFSLCSSGLMSASLVLSAIYLCMKVSLSTDIILCGWLGLKHQPAN